MAFNLTASFLAVAAFAALSPAQALAETDGISRLSAVTQIKASDANDEALAGAEKQRQLIGKQKSLKATQHKLNVGKLGLEKNKIAQQGAAAVQRFDKPRVEQKMKSIPCGRRVGC